jgi:hypothetical protein
LSALDAKLVAFPSAEQSPKPFPSLEAPRIRPRGASEEKFRGGSLRGLFWALLLEGAVVALVIGMLMAWHTMHF